MDIYDAMSRNPATVKAANSGGFTGQAFRAAFPHGPGNLLFGRSPAPEPKPGTPEHDRYLMDVVSNFVMPMTFIGERGMANLLGPKATKGLIGEAKGLEAAGVSAPEIKQATNMHRGMDGEWRYEIDDSGADFLPTDKMPWAASEGLKSGDSFVYGAGEIFKHPELDQAYPDGFLNFGNARDRMTITVKPELIENGSLGGKDITVGVKDGRPNRGTALHEMQHAVQDKEGFASGGSIEEMATQGIEDMPSYFKTPSGTVVTVNQGNAYFKFPDGSFKPVTVETAHKVWREEGAPTPFDQYQRLAGEIEARDVQSRMNMTPEERRATMPDLWDNAIVRRGGGEARSEGFLPKSENGFLSPKGAEGIAEETTIPEAVNMSEKKGFLDKHAASTEIKTKMNKNFDGQTTFDNDSYVSFGPNADEVMDEFGDLVPGDEYILIDRVYVSPNNRKKGLARKMLQKTIDSIKSKTKKPIRIVAEPLEDNISTEDLVGFYESMGFDSLDLPTASPVLEL